MTVNEAIMAALDSNSKMPGGHVRGIASVCADSNEIHKWGHQLKATLTHDVPLL